MFDKAEQKNKTLGLSTPHTPLKERNTGVVVDGPHKQQAGKKTPKKDGVSTAGAVVRASPKQKLARRSTERSQSAESKENADLSVEINITTGPNVQVDLHLFFICLFTLAR